MIFCCLDRLGEWQTYSILALYLLQGGVALWILVRLLWEDLNNRRDRLNERKKSNRITKNTH